MSCVIQVPFHSLAWLFPSRLGMTSVAFSRSFVRHVGVDGSPVIINRFREQFPQCTAEVLEFYLRLMTDQLISRQLGPNIFRGMCAMDIGYQEPSCALLFEAVGAKEEA